MTEKVKIYKKLEARGGVSKNGQPWAAQVVVYESMPDFYGNRHYIAVEARNDFVEELKKFPEGAEVEISFRISAREYNGKWYNDVRLSNIIASFQETPPVPQKEDEEDLPGSDDPDELPF